MSSFEEVIAAMSEKVAATDSFGKKINFAIDDHRVHIDGTATPPTLTLEDKPADVTIITSLENFIKVVNKEMNSQMAFMSGKIKLEGDMMAAMALKKILN